MYRAYKMTNSRPAKFLFEGTYETVRAWAETMQVAHYAKTGDHLPIFITQEIMAVRP